MTSTWTLKRKLFMTFAVVLTLISVLIGISMASTSKLLDTVKWNTHTYRVLQESQLMLLNMVNIETGLRGFVASGDEKFLEPFTQGLKDFKVHFDEVKSLTSDNPAQQTRLDKMMTLHTQFMGVANGLVALRRDANAGKISQDDLLKEFDLGKDKAAMDGFRAGVAEFSNVENLLLKERSVSLESTASFTIYVLGGGGFVLFLLSGGLGTLLSRSILGQLGGEPSLALQVADRVANGDLSVPVPVKSGDSASLMANLSRMQVSLAQVVSNVRQNAEGVATASSQIAQGNNDLSARTEQSA